MANLMRLLVALMATFLILVRGSSGQAPAVPPEPESVTVFFTSDIMQKGREHVAEDTGQQMRKLYEDNPGSIILGGGDISNDNGESESFDRLEQTSWKPLLSVMHMVAGNHEYDLYPLSLGRIPEFFFRFPKVGQPGFGWQTIITGALERVRWVIVGYNTELNRRQRDNNRFVDPDKALGQLNWLDTELRQNHNNKCILTFGHRPTFSSFRPPGSNSTHDPYAMPIAHKLHKYGVDLNVTGHLHGVNWVPPLNPNGEPDGNGVPTLVSAAGGAGFFVDPRKDPILPPARRRLKWGDDAGEQLLADTPGAAEIKLYPGYFKWRFLPTHPLSGVTYPSGEGRCHSNPPGYVEPAYN